MAKSNSGRSGKGGGSYSQQTSTKGRSSRQRNSGGKGNYSHRDNSYDNHPPAKGGGGYQDDYANDNYDNGGQGKGGGGYQDDYGNDNYGSNDGGYSDANSKGNSHSNDSYDNPDTGYTSNYYDGGYNDYHEDNSGHDSYSKQGYSENEPINDPPPYEDYDSGVSKQSGGQSESYSAKGGGDTTPEADMVFTEEEVYGDSEEHTGSGNREGRSGSIRRVWVWAGGAVPRHAIGNPQSNWWRNRFDLGMTDYIIALNDHDFSNGLGIKSNYIDRNNQSNRWAPICEILRTVADAGVSPHLMIFFPPHPGLIREAAEALKQIVQNSSVMPRSIQLDLEGWWTRRSARERSAGERAIQEHFIDHWNARRPELGIGITCIGSVPQSIFGAMQKVNFAIPQMYASERNYGRPLREASIRRHFNRAAESLGSQGMVIGGQTAYSRYVNPEIMKDMLEILLRQHHPNCAGIREIAYWSDVHLMNSSRNRQFFQRLTSLVRQEGLNSGNIERL